MQVLFHLSYLLEVPLGVISISWQHEPLPLSDPFHLELAGHL